MRHLPKHNQGFTFVELLIIMILIATLATIGSHTYQTSADGANTNASIIEMRGMVNILSIVKDSGLTFQSGTIAQLNASQTLIKLPEFNKFDNPYLFSLNPTIKIYSSFPLSNLHPIGVLAADVEHNLTSTTLTFHYRDKIAQHQTHRLQWIERFYYDKDNPNLTDRQTNAGAFKATNFLGRYIP